MCSRRLDTAYAKFVGTLCVCVLCVILIAGLWLFHVPANRVKWLKSENGLEFGGHGSAVSSGAFRASDLTGASGTLEVWLVPARSERSSTILSFDGSAHPGEPLSLHQKVNALGILRNNVDRQGVSRTAVFYCTWSVTGEETYLRDSHLGYPGNIGLYKWSAGRGVLPLFGVG